MEQAYSRIPISQSIKNEQLPNGSCFVSYYFSAVYVAYEKRDDISYALALKMTTDFVENVKSEFAQIGKSIPEKDPEGTDDSLALWWAALLEILGINSASVQGIGNLAMISKNLNTKLTNNMFFAKQERTKLSSTMKRVFIIAGLLLAGLGCAPIYPCAMHATPANFGPERSQALMGIQTASAYVGTALMPPLFGLIANHLSISLMGVFLAVMLVFMVISHELLLKKCSAK